MAQFPSLTLRQKRSLLWLILGLLVIGVLWAASSVLLPYGLGLVLAYLLLPPEDAMLRVRAGEELQLRV